MWCVLTDVVGCHPCLLVGVVQRVSVQGDVGGDDESIRVIGCYCHLHLGRGLSRLIHDYSDLLAVRDRLAALGRPDGQSFVCVDVAGDVSKRESSHVIRGLLTWF